MKHKHLTGNNVRHKSFKHTRFRAKQRYNLLINRKEYEFLCSEIKLNHFISKKQTKTKTIYKMPFKNSILYILYIPQSNRITTVLPYQRFQKRAYSQTG